jgi:hypothetical protein
VSGQLRDVLERGFEPVVGHRQVHLAHPRVVDQQPAAWEHDELAAGRRVAPRAVGAHVSRREELVACDPVDERRLADARRPEQGTRDAGPEETADPVDADPGPAGDEVNGDGPADPLELGRGRLRIGLEVGLHEQDHGLRAALEGERDVPLEQECVELLSERRRDEDDVDVCRDDLLPGRSCACVPGRPTHECRATWEHGLNDLVPVEADPVSDDRELRDGGCASEPRGDACPHLAALRHDVVGTPVLGCDAARPQALGADLVEGRAPLLVPTKRLEVRHAGIVT